MADLPERMVILAIKDSLSKKLSPVCREVLEKQLVTAERKRKIAKVKAGEIQSARQAKAYQNGGTVFGRKAR